MSWTLHGSPVGDHVGARDHRGAGQEAESVSLQRQHSGYVLEGKVSQIVNAHKFRESFPGKKGESTRQVVEEDADGGGGGALGRREPRGGDCGRHGEDDHSRHGGDRAALVMQDAYTKSAIASPILPRLLAKPVWP